MAPIKRVNPENLDGLSVMARTVFGEARGEGVIGQSAVAHVILTRARNPRWWGGPDIKSVCLQRWQFSVWLESDPNYELLTRTHDHLLANYPVFHSIIRVCVNVLTGDQPDPTGGADHYVRTDHIERTKWARENPDKAVAVIGDHTFFRLEV